jgi:hypothetical protein
MLWRDSFLRFWCPFYISWDIYEVRIPSLFFNLIMFSHLNFDKKVGMFYIYEDHIKVMNLKLVPFCGFFAHFISIFTADCHIHCNLNASFDRPWKKNQYSKVLRMVTYLTFVTIKDLCRWSLIFLKELKYEKCHKNVN